MEPKTIGHYIVSDPEICHGKPTFRGTRILVADVLEQVAEGVAWETVIAEWRGNLTHDAIAEAVHLLKLPLEQKPRIAGLHAGMGWVSDDFDDPLPDEVGILIPLLRLMDNWPTGTASTELQRNHAHGLRLHLASLFMYYYESGQENKAKLAATIHATTVCAETEGLTQAQISTIQTLFTYFQHSALTTDDLRTCSRLLWENGIDTAPEMPNWQAAIADH